MVPLAWLALAGVNAAMSAAKASQAGKQRKTEADLRAAEIEASPWTGRAPTSQITTTVPNIWGELLGAGVNTLSQGSALEGAGLFSGGAPTPEGLGGQNPLMQTSTGNAPTLFGRTPSVSPWKLFNQ